MNSAEFLKEVLESDICPEDFESAYSDFQKYQQLAIDTLNEFHRVCEANGIDYQLAYGSLLGAIRDNGQIPWDYDIDVVVPYEQKDRLIQALNKDLSDDFYFYSPDVSSKCRHFIMRLTPKGYRSEALHVDVFWLAGVPSDAEERQEYVGKIKKAGAIRYKKLVKITETPTLNIKRILRIMSGRLLNLFVPISKLDKDFDELCTKYKLDESEYCFSTGPDNKLSYPTKLFRETKLITNPYGTYRISTAYDEILSMMYGDYMKVYPLQGRIDEMYRSLKRLRYFHEEKK